MKDTITINYKELETIRKSILLRYIDTHVRVKGQYLEPADSFLRTQSGSATTELEGLSTEIMNFIQFDISLVRALMDKIESSSVQMEALLAPISKDSTIRVRRSSVETFLANVKAQLAAAYELPPISQTFVEHKEWIKYGVDSGYWNYIQWKYNNEGKNADNIFEIQTIVRNTSYDNCHLLLGQMQAIYDKNITPFFQLDEQLSQEFDIVALSKVVFESLPTDAAKEEFIRTNIIIMLFTSDEVEAKKLQDMIAATIIAAGTNVSGKVNLKDITFRFNGAECKLSFDFKAKTNVSGANQELQFSISKQLSEIKFALAKSNVIAAYSESDVNLGFKIDNVSPNLSLKKLRDEGILSVTFTHKMESTKNFDLTTSLTIEKDLPGAEFKSRLDANVQEVVSGQFMALSWEKVAESVKENPEVLIPVALVVVVVVIAFPPAIPPAAIAVATEVAAFFVALSRVVAFA